MCNHHCPGSLPELLDAHVALGVLLHDFGDGHLEVLLRDVDTALAERKPTEIRSQYSGGVVHANLTDAVDLHSRLGTHGLKADERRCWRDSQ